MRLADQALAAMGGKEKLQAIQVLVMKGGTGTRYRLGQTMRPGDAETPPPELTNVVETADLLNGRASLDYELKNGDFTQHRHEILTSPATPSAVAPGTPTSPGVPAAPQIGIEIVGTRPDCRHFARRPLQLGDAELAGVPAPPQHRHHRARRRRLDVRYRNPRRTKS